MGALKGVVRILAEVVRLFAGEIEKGVVWRGEGILLLNLLLVLHLNGPGVLL